MSTITTINAGDNISDSRAVINDNLAALNSDKIETSVIDTDTTLAANSDAKIPSQKAVKAYVDAGGNVNASTTGKGIVEEATQAEVDAGTATGGTGARLFVNPSTMPRSALTLIPLQNGIDTSVVNSKAVSGTTAILGQVVIPFSITVNKVSIRNTGVSVAGTLDISMYTEDGQTQIFSVTTASISGTNTITTTAVSAVSIRAGVYYVLINANSTANITVQTWESAGSPFSNTEDLMSDIASEPVIRGTLTITADTPPTTFDPTAITESTRCTPIVRLDN